MDLDMLTLRTLKLIYDPNTARQKFNDVNSLYYSKHGAEMLSCVDRHEYLMYDSLRAKTIFRWSKIEFVRYYK